MFIATKHALNMHAQSIKKHYANVISPEIFQNGVQDNNAFDKEDESLIPPKESTDKAKYKSL